MENKIPDSWVECKFGDVAKIHNGYAFATKDFRRDKGVPLIKQTQLNGDRIDLTKCVYLDKSFLETKKDFILKKGDVLIGMSGSVGKMCLYDLDFPALQNQRTGKAVPLSDNLLNKKLFWYFLSTIEQTLLDRGKGMGVTNVSADDIENLTFNLSPLAEQDRIVAKLDAVMQKVESNKQRLDKIPKLLKRFRQSVLAAAVSGKLTEDWREKNGIVDEWEEKKLAQCGEITGGITLNSKRQQLPLKMPYLRVGNVYSNHFILDEIKTIGVLEREIKRALLENGDLLIVEGNGSSDQIGRVAQWKGEIENCLHQNHLIKFRSNNYYTSRYILYYLLSFQGREQIEEASKSTSGLYTLSISKVANLSICIAPTVEEQQEIVRRVEQLFAFADRIETRYTKAKAMLDKLPQSILAKAFRGELVPQDPNDEPASMLLKRIKAEKEKLAKEKQDKKSKKAH